MRIIWLLGVLLGFTGFSVEAMAGTKDRPPNFIVILADDLGAKELGCYGNQEHKTPNLDRLAREGMRFETCYAEPICSPTRVTLMTGQYGFRTGYFNLMGRKDTPLPDSPDYDVAEKFTFADLLRPKGYATALSGKWQLPGQIPNLIHDCGFDTYRMWAYNHNLPKGVTHTGEFEGQDKPSRYWHPSIVQNSEYLPTKPDDYGPDLFTDFIIDFARENRERPFFAYFPMPLTHGPYLETPDPAHPGKRLPGGFKSNLEYLDHVMGRLVDEIDAMGLAENTLIIFVGDNGTGGSGKGQVSELGARVPLIVRGPGMVKAGVVSRELVDITDIFATMADLAGASVPEGHVIDGRSLATTLRGEPGRHRDWIFSFLSDGKILRDERWLLELKGNGTEKFWDCGESRDGTGYRDVTESENKEVRQARLRFAKILEQLPGPENHPGLRRGEDVAQAEAKAQQKKAVRKAAAKKKPAGSKP